MKKIFVIGILAVGLFSGCAAFNEGKADFAACWNDPVCREEASRKSEDVASKAAAISAVSPIPGTPVVVRPIASAIGLIVFLVLGGRALRKKKESVPA